MHSVNEVEFCIPTVSKLRQTSPSPISTARALLRACARLSHAHGSRVLATPRHGFVHSTKAEKKLPRGIRTCPGFLEFSDGSETRRDRCDDGERPCAVDAGRLHPPPPIPRLLDRPMDQAGRGTPPTWRLLDRPCQPVQQRLPSWRHHRARRRAMARARCVVTCVATWIERCGSVHVEKETGSVQSAARVHVAGRTPCHRHPSRPCTQHPPPPVGRGDGGPASMQSAVGAQRRGGETWRCKCASAAQDANLVPRDGTRMPSDTRYVLHCVACGDLHRSQTHRACVPTVELDPISRAHMPRGKRVNATRQWHCIAGDMDGMAKRMIDIHFRPVQHMIYGIKET